MTQDQQPISGLDEALDLLVEVLTRTPDLSGLIEGLRAYELALALVPIGAPAAVDAVSVAATWGALADVASEVLALREKADHGNKA